MIILKNNHGFPWTKRNNIYIKGYFYNENREIPVEEIFSLIEKNIDSLEDLYPKIRGNFLIVVEKEEKEYTILADKLRSFPLLYSFDKEWILSDTALSLKEELESREILLTVNQEALREFKMCSFTLGHHTLYENISGINSCSVLNLKEDGSSKEKRFREIFDLCEDLKCLEEEIDEIPKILEKILKRIIATAKSRNKQLIVPLSGGQDSRLIIHTLAQLQAENILCYTYGTKSSPEVQISKKIAEFYNYPWKFVEYTPDKWKNFIARDDFKELLAAANQFISTPHIQEYMALKELLRQGYLEKGGIILPGFSGDFLQGSNIPPYFIVEENISWKNFYEEVKGQYFSHILWDEDMKSHEDEIRESIRKKSEFITSSLPWREVLNRYERFGFEDRKLKFIVNSCRVYELFGLEWRTPLWNEEYFHFWKGVPEKRYARELHYLYTQKYQKELQEYLGSAPKHPALPKADLTHFIRKYFPNVFQNIKHKKNHRELLKKYKADPYGWFLICDDREWEKYKNKVYSVNSIVSLKTSDALDIKY